MITNVHLTGLARELAQRAATGKPIRVGVIGSGEMGTDLVTQGSLMRGIEVVAISTRRPHTAREAIRIAFGEESRAAEAETAGKVTAAIEDGRIAICSNELLGKKRLPSIDHDHTTGEVRGLLCNKCNCFIGLADENIDVLTSAIAYLLAKAPWEPLHQEMKTYRR